MKRYKNILVGVDLSAGDRLVVTNICEDTPAIPQAVWLAKLNGGQIRFVYSLDISERAQHLIHESTEAVTVLDQARNVLHKLVERVAEQGIKASFEVVFGRSWMELIRQVLRFEHDLVLVGSRNHSATSTVLFGSTATKLLRKCPCPVWITKPSQTQQVASVLVAHDLTPVGSLALDLGASLSELQNCKLHVLHVLEPEPESILGLGTPARTAVEREQAARSQIEAELKDFELSTYPQIVISENVPSTAILKYLEEHFIELIAMGTIAHTGVGGLLTGSTAERLLPYLPCSVLAVKPADFVSPVTLS